MTMCDYEAVLKQARTCANRKYCDIGANCEYYDAGVCCQGGEKDILNDAADAIEELVAAVPKWISVEEPPDNGRNIFICHGSADFKAPCIGHYEPNMKLFYEDKNWFASPIYDAMYWCEMPELPLPDPPKEVRDA